MMRNLLHRAGRAIWALRYRRVTDMIRLVQANRLTYLDRDALRDLAAVALKNERDGVPGVIVEAGCALGGSAIVIASAKSTSRPLYVFDVFGLIPPPSDRDGPDAHNRYGTIRARESEGINGDKYYGYVQNLREQVAQNFAKAGVHVSENNVTLVEGLFADTMDLKEDVSLAHIDCDWYDSVWTCLERIVPRLVHGGTLVIDDYGAWSGCKTAVDAYFKTRSDDFRFEMKSRLHVTKK